MFRFVIIRPAWIVKRRACLGGAARLSPMVDIIITCNEERVHHTFDREFDRRQVRLHRPLDQAEHALACSSCVSSSFAEEAKDTVCRNTREHAQPSYSLS